MLYEVLGYDSEAAFDARCSRYICDSMIRRQDARRLAHMNLDSTYPIVKVQSHDREFIEILRRQA